jgi:hypothetical protein
MRTGTVDLASLPEPLASTLGVSLPCSRAAALDRWSQALAMLSVIQVAVVALGAAFQRRSSTFGEGTTGPTLHALLGALFLPLLFVSLARFAERRLLHRPPKGLLLVQFGVYVLGAALATAATLLFEVASEASRRVFLVSHGTLALAFLALAVWTTGAYLAAPAED